LFFATYGEKSCVYFNVSRGIKKVKVWLCSLHIFYFIYLSQYLYFLCVVFTGFTEQTLVRFFWSDFYMPAVRLLKILATVNHRKGAINFPAKIYALLPRSRYRRWWRRAGRWFRTGGILLQPPQPPATATRKESDELAANDDLQRRRDFRRSRRGRDDRKGSRDLGGRARRPQGRKQVRGGSIRCRASDAERHLSTGSARRIRSHVRGCELTWNKYRFASCAWRKSLLRALVYAK